MYREADVEAALRAENKRLHDENEALRTELADVPRLIKENAALRRARSMMSNALASAIIALRKALQRPHQLTRLGQPCSSKELLEDALQEVKTALNES